MIPMFFLLTGITVTGSNGYFPGKIYVSDLEPEGFNKIPVLFQIDCREDEGPGEYRLTYSLYHQDKLLLDGSSDPFSLENGEEIVLTSRDLGNPESRFYITSYHVYTGGGGEINTFLSRGILLPGDYRLAVGFIDLRSGATDTTIYFDIQILPEPGIEAISPGVPCGEYPTIVSERPLFVWMGDCDSFELKIGLFINKSLSPEENLSSYIVLNKKGLKTNTFQIPQEYPPLERGDYVWEVTGFKTTSSGIETITSVPMCFSVQPSTINEIVEILKMKLGQSHPVIKEIEGKKFVPTGAIFLNGKPITIEELKELLSNSKNIKSVRWK